ncbi:MAG: beta strand repeat-containing protein [Verrucomicrobiota bacterium]
MKVLLKSVALGLVVTAGLSASGAEILKANNADAMNLSSSWQGGIVPGAGDIAAWTNGSGSSVVSLGADTSWNGIKVYTPGGTPTIAGGYTLALDAGGIALSGNNFNMSNTLVLTASQVWNLGTKALFFRGPAIKGTNVTIDILSGGSTFVDIHGSPAGGLSGTINYGAPARLRVLGAFNATNVVLNIFSGANFDAQGYNGTTRVGDLISTNTKAGLGGADQNGTVTYEIGSLGNTSTWAGKILNGGATGTARTSIRKIGSGIWTLTGTNTYTGTTTIDGGAIQVGSSDSLLGTSSTTSLVTVNTANGLRFTNGLTSFTLYGLAGSTSGSLSLVNDLAGPLALTVNEDVNSTFAGTLSGSGSLTKSGSGILTLSGANTYSGATTVSAGKLITSTASTGAGDYSVANSAILSVKLAAANGTLNMNSLTADASSTIEVDLATFGTPSSSSPVIAVSGDFTPSATVTLQLIGGGPTLATGQFPLIKYGNASSPGIGALNLVVPSGITASLVDNVANQSIDVNISAITPLVWDGTQDGNWDIGLTANWKTGLYTETAIGGPAVTFDDTAAGANTTITSGSPTTVSPMSVTVSNSAKAYDIGGNLPIGGTGGLLKKGDGELTLSASNSYSGGTILAEGKLNVNHARFGGTGTLTIQGGALDNTSGADVTVAQNNSQLWAGDFAYLGTANNLNLGSGAVTLDGNRQIAVSNNTLTVGGVIDGAFSLTKTGPGALALTGDNLFSGGVTMNEGSLNLGAGNNHTLGSGTLTLNGGLVNLGYNRIYANNIVVAGAATMAGAANNYAMSGSVSGSGTLTLKRNASSGVIWFSGDFSGFNGTVIGDGTGFPDTQNSYGPITNGYTWVNVAVDLRNGARFRGEPGGTNRIGSIIGETGTTFGYMGGVFEVGYLNLSNTFNGTMADTGTNVVSLVKVGSNLLELTGDNSYTGGTTVSAGELRVNNVSGSATGPNAVLVQADAKLAGKGSIAGAVPVESSGTLAPGNNDIGTLTLTQAPTLGGVVSMEIDRSAVPNCDVLNVSDALTYGGTLQVSNLGAPVQLGDSFTLFQASSHIGSFSSLALPPTPSGTTWELTNGVLTVVAGSTPPAPAVLTKSFSGGNLTLSWPANEGWRLMKQTNSLSVGLSNNWTEVTESLGTNSVTLPVDPNAKAVFYRLVYP